MKTDFDLLIVGAGMVGSSLALALQNIGLRIALVEAQDLLEHHQPGFDDRGIALSYGSQRIFETMQLWSQLADKATPIHGIHISDRGHFGVTRLNAQTEKVPALGQVMTAKHLGIQLNQALQQHPTLSILTPIHVNSLEQNATSVSVNLSDGQQLTTRLLVGADGQFSTIRNLLGLTSWQREYQQTAITANVIPERAHQNWAYERFTEHGPLALLPMSEGRCSLVWTVKTGEEQALLLSNEQQFAEQLQKAFGYRLGHFEKIGQRSSYPLGLMQTNQPVQNRVVLIGNAAHSLHPIAGQGFNLGLRDAAVLAELIAARPEDCGHASLLQDYSNWQQQDQDKVVNATDFLVNTFSNNHFLLGHGRSLSLALLNGLPRLKNQLAKTSMGLSGKQSRLSRGLPL
ncbi:2-octaprenyl-6-methoxyphenyl hydroxylase [Methylophaga nitratireducenticrescens]|uniref:2-octaprenyl-6-methoxyphenol hydroxylase n=1 Tax=Methylophaga nitratireducenticrescens TaxID=754476 RepID=I1XMS4_METNJ|nr:2-octaprenyl-6-methoxyphenyl hydroxylase [Methylophaga nitratireducenticrescens]